MSWLTSFAGPIINIFNLVFNWFVKSSQERSDAKAAEIASVEAHRQDGAKSVADLESSRLQEAQLKKMEEAWDKEAEKPNP